MVIVFAVPMFFKAFFSPFHYHSESGTNYHEDAIESYVKVNHGPDGKLFLDPYFSSEIESLNGCRVLDAGCGAGPWAAYAAKQNGDVYALDLQEKMIQAASAFLAKEKLSDKVKLTQGDVANLPYEDNFFDKAISICVTCNLTADAFEKHFKEFQRSVKDNGTIVISAPASLDVVFTDGSKTESEVYEHIHSILSAMPDDPSPEIIMQELNKLTEITSATFYISNKRLKLVANQNSIPSGTSVWRKLHNTVIPNRLYTKSDYFNILKKTGFEIVRLEEPHFKSEEERVAYNRKSPPDQQLGESYTSHAPFLTIKAQKKPITATLVKN